MKQSGYSSPRTLLIVWLALMGLSGATMIAGKVNETLSLGAVWLAVLLVVAGLKSSLILHYYLDLKSASDGWNKLFTFTIWLILLAVFLIYLAGTSIR